MLKWFPLGAPLYVLTLSLLNYSLKPGPVRLALTTTMAILAWVTWIAVVIAKRKRRASAFTTSIR